VTGFDLSGKRAVVTGGSRGIGLAIATALSAQGARVASWARGEAANEAAMRPLGGLAVPCDVTDRAAITRAMEATLAEFGQVDILVVNAGRRGEDVLFPATSMADWDAVIATNLTAVFGCVQTFAGHAIERGGGGKVIIVSSIGAEFAMPRAIAYASAKAALTGLTRSAATALARHDVQVNCVQPGWTRTDLAASQLDDERIRAALIRRTPARRFAEPADIAGVCVYLGSAESDFHTGDVLRVDGGFVIS
jgi:NAD(P)-dependent dehydrogenase (short-subunit alcohol dehydrogenase family)